MNDDNINWGPVFYDHMIKYLGNPVNREIFRQAETEPVIQILEFNNVFPGCRVFGSIGASNYSSILGTPSEVILSCDDGWEVAGALLGNALFYLVQEKMELGRGVAIGLEHIAPEFAKRFEKPAIYFSNPLGLPSEFAVVRNVNLEGRMYLAFFISKAEFDYFCDRGAHEFETYLEHAEVDPFSMNRRSSL